ncbi:MAG: exodeoxyribonuclease VII large subunit [Clostridia bacterium]|jgi:exodeoxyribonuclease VII large subunit|nr:exodeoxyribonuclease VII large subunit [Clostridia bacterium]
MTTVTVSQLNRYVRSLIESDARLAHVMISGEISNLVNHYKSGHIYFSLKDESALVRAVMFRSQAIGLKFSPENGMKVIVRARVSLYEKDGAYQIYVDDMQPDGAGALQLAFEQLKARLEAEGLFAAERKQPLPRYPSCIGVITSSTGAAVRDIFNVLGRRYPLAQVVLLPVLVQGEGAAPQLVQAIRTFEEMRRENHPQTPDVIIIGRGGGSLEELWAFNDEQLARTVAASVIPVISAVGHETDFTICDFAADLRAPTPSAAAELAVPDANELLQRVALLRVATERALHGFLQQKRQRLELLSTKPCLSSPLYFSEERAMRLDYLLKRFTGAANLAVSRANGRLSEMAGKLHALSPLQVLSRGYSIACHGETVIQSVDDVAIGDEITLRVRDGEIGCQATTKMKE